MFLLVPAHPSFPGQIPQSRKTVVVVVCISRVRVSKVLGVTVEVRVSVSISGSCDKPSLPQR